MKLVLPAKYRQYTLHRLIGAGVDGEVYEALSDGARQYAVKLVTSTKEGRREALLLESLREVPGILQLYDHGTGECKYTDGMKTRYVLVLAPFLRMDVKMATLIDEIGALDWVSLGMQMGIALRRIHERRIVHGDLHPGNVGIDAHGNYVLIDFGRAIQYDEDGTTTDDDCFLGVCNDPSVEQNKDVHTYPCLPRLSGGYCKGCPLRYHSLDNFDKGKHYDMLRLCELVDSRLNRMIPHKGRGVKGFEIVENYAVACRVELNHLWENRSQPNRSRAWYVPAHLNTAVTTPYSTTMMYTRDAWERFVRSGAMTIEFYAEVKQPLLSESTEATVSVGAKRAREDAREELEKV